MKNYMKTLAICTFIVSLMTFMACGGDEPLSKEEQVTQLLVGKSATAANVWKMQSVDVDGVDQTSIYSGLTIKFTDGQFTATNGGGLWPATGTWTFSGTEGSTIKRDDGTEIKVTVTEILLTLEMSWTKTTLGPGRVSSVSGQHKIKLSKQ
jgi:hypothetical protein